MYLREGAWEDDPSQAQELCEILRRSHPGIMKDLEEAAMKMTSPGIRDVIQGQVDFAYEEGRNEGYLQGHGDGRAELKKSLREFLKEEEA